MLVLRYRRLSPLLAAALSLFFLLAALHPGRAVARSLAGHPQLIDNQAPFAEPRHVEGVSCASVSLCAAIDASGHVLTSMDPAGSMPAWRLQTVERSDSLTAISCAAASFCAVSDRTNHIFTTSDADRAGGGDWSTHSVAGAPEGIEGLSCPSTSLCVAVGSSSNSFLISSRDPAKGRRAAWHATRLRGISLDAVSCPTTHLCVATGSDGAFAVSRDPGSAHAKWRRSVLGSQNIEGLSCPSEHLCVAYYINGYLSSTDPLDGPNARWSANPSLAGEIRPGAEPTAISCTSESLCVLTANDGTMTVSSNPALGAGASWHLIETHTPPYLGALSCVTDVCIAGNSTGRVIAVHPLAGSYAVRYVDGYNPLDAVSCERAFCAATGQGTIFTTADAAASEPAWSHRQLDAAGLGGVSCPAPGFCAAAGADGTVFVSSDPTSTASWQATRIAGAGRLIDISCVGTELCAALDNEGHAFFSTDPIAAAPSDWVRAPVPALEAGALRISCGSIRLCVIMGLSGIATSTDPALGAASHWSVRRMYSRILTGVSCAGERFCALAERETGEVLVSTDPARGRSARWRSSLAFSKAPIEDDLEISCLPRGSCLVVDEHGRDALTEDARSSRPRWRTGILEPLAVPPLSLVGISAVSCAEPSICGAVDGEGRFVQLRR
jgi:hypothetical protein